MKRALLVLLIVGSLAFIACEDWFDVENTYKYEVTGTATSVRVTITDKNGGTAQHTVDIPWSYSFDKLENENIFLYLSAQNQDNEGTVTVKIYIEDKVIKETTSSGAYCIASANYSYRSPY
jgi:hypothetical protein